MTNIANFTGELSTPGSPTYSVASVTHAVHSSSPAIVTYPCTTADVAAAIAYAGAEQLPLAVRSGGHTAYSSIDGGLVIDLSEFNAIEVLDDGLVRIGSGALWGDVAAALTPHGIALSSGDASTVGVGGLALSGGIGWLVRQVGLTIDSVVALEVVLASGEIVIASADSEPELFWALRGGGGNFGVVTNFTFRAHPLGRIIAGSVSFDPTDLAAALTGWRNVMRESPELLNSTFTQKPAFGPQVPASIMATFCYADDNLPAADAAIQPLLDLPTVIASEVAEKTYPDMLTAEHLPEGLTIVDNNGFTEDLTDSLIAEIVTLNGAVENSVLMLRWLGGALNGVPQEATAFAHRTAQALLVTAVVFPPGAPVLGKDLIDARWAAVAKNLLGMYGNFIMDARPGAANVMYPATTLERLRSLKTVYDPTNVFALNHNIAPL